MDDDRSFPEAVDGRPLPRMAEELMIAGLSEDDARFVSRQLRQDGYYLIRQEDIGWPQIRAFQEALRGGQCVREDGGGFFSRCIMALFGAKPDPVETYQLAAARLLREMDGDSASQTDGAA